MRAIAKVWCTLPVRRQDICMHAWGQAWPWPSTVQPPGPRTELQAPPVKGSSALQGGKGGVCGRIQQGGPNLGQDMRLTLASTVQPPEPRTEL